jgi:hypothetical protein
MPLGRLPRESVLRGVAVVVITASVALGAACSDEDVVDTIPPPRPNRTTTVEGTQGVPSPATTTTTTTSTTTSTSPSTVTSAPGSVTQ